MRTYHSRTLKCSLSLLAAVSLPAALPARAAADDPSAPLFHQVIPRPTGKNGYELLVLAADAFKASPRYQQAQEPDTTLEFRRHVLADRQVVRALKLLRDGLDLPIASPRESVSFSTTFPELAAFRSLARLLAVQQYVFLADGRVADALANVRLGLKFSQAVQTDTLISGLVGAAIGTICLDPLGRHLDQLSAGDCAALYQICREWLAQPNPQVRVMANERSATRSNLEEIEREIKQRGAAAAAGELGQIEGWEALQGSLKQLESAPTELDALFADVEKRMDDHLDRALKEMEMPPWERKPLSLDETDLAGKLAAALTPAYDRVDERYTRAAARVRLLACHCAIHRYRWEYDRLPLNLAVLNLGELATDPFTGLPLQYAVRGSRYTLTSAGSPADPSDPQTVNGRLPVSLMPGE